MKFWRKIMSENCCSNNGIRLLYACAGAADVGELSDRVVRKLWGDGFATKTCLAGVGGDVHGFVKSAQGADENIVIDGCSQTCAKKCLERIGVKPTSIVLADLGYKKGESPVTQEKIDVIAGLIKSIAPAPIVSGSGSSCCC
jgi:uncharacterized metal-binding protein